MVLKKQQDKTGFFVVGFGFLVDFSLKFNLEETTSTENYIEGTKCHNLRVISK